MIEYMPVPHRELLREAERSGLREYVTASEDSRLIDAYNASLQGVLEFRSLHLAMARAYVAKRLDDPIGTGGTPFMTWLTRLRDETGEQML